MPDRYPPPNHPPIDHIPDKDIAEMSNAELAHYVDDVDQPAGIRTAALQELDRRAGRR